MEQQLFDAALEGDVPSMLSLLLSGADPNAKVGTGDETALHIACQNKNLTAVQTLLLAKAFVDAKAIGGETPLYYACEKGSAEIVETLCQAGADVDAEEDDLGETPLMKACRHEDSDREEIVGILIAKGAKVNLKDKDNETALHNAADNGSANSIVMLLDKGAHIEARTNWNDTPLHYACYKDRLDAVKVLVQRGANIFSKGEADQTPLDQASESPEIIDFLLKEYKERIVASAGRLSLHALLQEATYDDSPTPVNLKIGSLTTDQFVELLVVIHSQNRDWIRIQDNNRNLPLHIACRTNAPLKVIRFLVDQDPSTLHMMNSAGCLPIHEACSGCMPLETIKYLVEKGGVGTLCARDIRCALPLHVSCESKPPVDVVKFLLKMYSVSASEKTSAGALPAMLATECKAPAAVLYVLLTAYPEAVAFMQSYYNPKK